MATTRNVGRGGGHSPANVTKHLKGIDFPAKKQDLLKQAKQSDADQDVLKEIQSMEDREYGSMADVMKAYGKAPEQVKKQASPKQTSPKQTSPKGRPAH